MRKQNNNNPKNTYGEQGTAAELKTDDNSLYITLQHVRTNSL